MNDCRQVDVLSALLFFGSVVHGNKVSQYRPLVITLSIKFGLNAEYEDRFYAHFDVSYSDLIDIMIFLKQCVTLGIKVLQYEVPKLTTEITYSEFGYCLRLLKVTSPDQSSFKCCDKIQLVGRTLLEILPSEYEKSVLSIGAGA